MKRLLWALLLVSVMFSAWGLFLEKAIAADSGPASQEVLPAGIGWDGQPILGVATRPPPEDVSQYLTPVSESANSDDSTPSYSSDESSGDD